MDSQTHEEPQLELRPACTIVGMRVDCPNFDASPIGGLWERFAPRSAELPETDGLWGISLPLPDGAPGFRYWACAIVPPGTRVPEGMESLELGQNNFLVREFPDTMDKVGTAFQEMYHKDMPRACLSSSNPFISMEFYAPDWMDGGDGRARMKLYVGVRRA